MESVARKLPPEKVLDVVTKAIQSKDNVEEKRANPSPQTFKPTMKRKKQQSTTYGKTSVLKKNFDIIYILLSVNTFQFNCNLF